MVLLCKLGEHAAPLLQSIGSVKSVLQKSSIVLYCFAFQFSFFGFTEITGLFFKTDIKEADRQCLLLHCFQVDSIFCSLIHLTSLLCFL